MKKNININYFIRDEHGKMGYIYYNLSIGSYKLKILYNPSYRRYYVGYEKLSDINILSIDKKYTHFISFRIRLGSFYEAVDEDDLQIKYHCTEPYLVDEETLVEVLDTNMNPILVNLHSGKVYEIRKKDSEEMSCYLGIGGDCL